MQVTVDDRAREWIAGHRSDAWVLDYEVHRCCGGGKICEVKMRVLAADDRPRGYVATTLPDGAPLLVDPRAARRLPSRIGLTVRGIGPLKRLDLDLTGEEWGELLYT